MGNAHCGRNLLSNGPRSPAPPPLRCRPIARGAASALHPSRAPRPRRRRPTAVSNLPALRWCGWTCSAADATRVRRLGRCPGWSGGGGASSLPALFQSPSPAVAYGPCCAGSAAASLRGAGWERRPRKRPACLPVLSHGCPVPLHRALHDRSSACPLCAGPGCSAAAGRCRSSAPRLRRRPPADLHASPDAFCSHTTHVAAGSAARHLDVLAGARRGAVQRDHPPP